MRVGLAVPRITTDVETNLSTIARLAEQAAAEEADLVLFPEAVTTGLSLTDRFEEDLALGTTIPGPITEHLGEVSRSLSVWLGVGFLERAGDRLYDAAVLLSPDGSLALSYRRIDSHWHASRVPPNTYCEGSDLGAVDTPLGRLAFAVCGDLFNDIVVECIRTVRPDVILHPMARCLSIGSRDQDLWDSEELGHYAARAKAARATTLTVNYLADPELSGGACGGAWALGPDGSVLARFPLGTEGVLVADLE